MAIVKNILFDLGNVLIPISPETTLKKFQDLGFHGELHDVYKIPIFIKYETGKVSTEIFIESLQDILKQAPPDAIREAWNAMILEINTKIFDFLNLLCQRYKLFLLSNTNELHAVCFEPKIVKATHRSIQSFFSKVYYSHHLKMRKPDENIFQYILDDAAIQPQETLFIDDSLENITTAKRLNFNTIHFVTAVDSIQNVIETYLQNQ